MAKPPKFTRNPAARTAFLANKVAIAAALENGGFMRTIFEEMRLPGSYTQFTRYVAQYLPDARPTQAARPSPPAASEATPNLPGTGDGPAEPQAAAPVAPSDGPLRARPETARPVYDPNKINPEELF